MTERPLPWSDLVEALGEERLRDIRAGIEAEPIDELDRDAFVLHRSAGAVLRELVPRDGDPEAVTAYGALLHMIYLMWRHDWPVAPAPRLPVFYRQLPVRQYWADNEPIDGVFVLRRDGHVQVVGVLGMNELRTGFTTVEAEADLPLPALEPRDDGSPPYASVLPGGDRAGLKSVVNAAELLWLADG